VLRKMYRYHRHVSAMVKKYIVDLSQFELGQQSNLLVKLLFIQNKSMFIRDAQRVLSLAPLIWATASLQLRGQTHSRSFSLAFSGRIVTIGFV
jgi:hypothetical protein